MALYKGFSTVSGTANYRLTDFDLVKQDLINHFNIRKGQKLMNPDYGTVIWDLIFEPFNDATKQAIETDIKRIVASDPRIGVRSAVITQYDYGVQIELDLVFVQTNQVGTLALQFDQNSKRITRV
jgi:phage baseplate assembly protein W